jgi:hypothetical protein
MKKLLLLIPVVLVLLNVLPIASIKDNVKFGESLDTLSPSHWKLVDLNAGVTATNIDFDFSGETQQQQPTNSADEPLSKDASFKGFPFGAYFSRADSQTVGSAQSSSFSASAYSWLWIAVDSLLLIGATFAVFKVNRGTGKGTSANSPAPATPFTPNPNTYAPPQGNQPINPASAASPAVSQIPTEPTQDSSVNEPTVKVG